MLLFLAKLLKLLRKVHCKLSVNYVANHLLKKLTLKAQIWQEYINGKPTLHRL